MSKSQLLNTKTSTFLELIGNGKEYYVPPFQRNYAWKEEHWDDLWKDIQELNLLVAEAHYMGTLVIEQESDRRFRIIDGQQRITTLSLFALAVIDRLLTLSDLANHEDSNRQRAEKLKEDFIQKKDSVSLLPVSKLTLNTLNDGFYQDYLLQRRTLNNPSRRLESSNQLLWSCFKWFQKKLQDYSNGVELAKLLSDSVGRQLIFILITVDNDLNAYTVFETLNARGLELTSTDLIKNYLFSLVKTQSDLSSLQRRWESMIETVREEKFPDFARYLLQREVMEVRKPRLFKLLRSKITVAQDVFDYIHELEAYADLYEAINKPDHDWWKDDYKDCQPYVKALSLFGVTQMLPLVFAGWEKASATDFKRLLKLLVVITFRYSVIGKNNPNILETIYPQAAKLVLSEGTPIRFPRLVSILKPLYINDDIFKTDFANRTFLTKSGNNKARVKYILSHLETALSGRDDEFDSATIEHILPENPSDSWVTNFSPDNQTDYCYRLGNMTLLERTKNKSAGAKPFCEKQVIYSQSQYRLSQSVGDEDVYGPEWTPGMIEKRQKQMAENAASIWKADFI